ncbi:ArsR family transcriptional regulator [Allofrancisella inopinata]|uniref:Helix-turn-helix type 11 domain-containing protein n=1 Tax=Allofrancisella inopinata TaxID=1085647 RepID=A0AAE6YIF7_9GAMM|nr:hypothetical protein [Allofrancisella inopinata]QIV96550.1 hypothetical protein E4K63_06805 [Allofrancisella inopinata]TDT71332.1 ArsR family transcriptional regulator [Allofrancisella inopinata]
MRIPYENEFIIKKSILKAIEKNASPAKLASSFGISKSTIYKYRRALRDQGFVKKNENGIYVIVVNKFSIQHPTEEFDNSFSLAIETCTPAKYTKIKDTSMRDDIEQRLQSKVEEMRMRKTKQEHDNEKGVFKKLLRKFKKNNNPYKSIY